MSKSRNVRSRYQSVPFYVRDSIVRRDLGDNTSRGYKRPVEKRSAVRIIIESIYKESGE